MESSERLLKLATDRLGTNGYIELAVLLGIVPPRALDRSTRLEGDRDKAKRVDNWLRGLNAPRLEDAMELLSRAGLLQPEAEAAWRGITLEAAELVVEAARAHAALAPAQGARERPAPRTRKSA